MGRKKKNRSKAKYDIPDPGDDVLKVLDHLGKYDLGKQGVDFYQVKSLKPVFAFDYLSLKGTERCYNQATLSIKDYLGILQGLKKISSWTYNDLNMNPTMRFHKVDFDDDRVAIKRSDFLNALAPSGRGMNEEELPTLYQFDPNYAMECRLVGFLFKGVFYLVWLDRDHLIYPMKKK